MQGEGWWEYEEIGRALFAKCSEALKRTIFIPGKARMISRAFRFGGQKKPGISIAFSNRFTSRYESTPGRNPSMDTLGRDCCLRMTQIEAKTDRAMP